MEAAQGQYDAAREQHDLVVQGTRDEEVNIARADLRYAEAVLDELQNGARVEDIDAANAVHEMAKAELARAQVNLDEMTITAPMDGVVESLDVHAGDLVGPRPIVELVDPDDLDVMIYVSAALLGHLRIGQTIPFTADSHGGTAFEGTVVHINNLGEFTPRNLQTQQEREQQMFGVRLTLDSYDGQLRPGMTITARVPAHPSGP
jgi:multidrug resistance efflux pump